MTSTTAPAIHPPAATPLQEEQPLHRFTVDEAIAMTEAGILTELDRVEMIEGVLVEMTPEGQRHIGRVTGVNTLLVRAYDPPGYGISVQCTLRLHERGFRIPDFVVTNAPLSERPPRPDEIALVIEVAYSSLRTDLGAKARDYAVFGVEDYWVLDLRGRRLVTYAEPLDGRYGQVRTLTERERITLPRTDVTVSVAELLPHPGTPPG